MAGARYAGLLKSNEAIVAKNVMEQIFDRHMKPQFIVGYLRANVG